MKCICKHAVEQKNCFSRQPSTTTTILNIIVTNTDQPQQIKISETLSSFVRSKESGFSLRCIGSVGNVISSMEIVMCSCL